MNRDLRGLPRQHPGGPPRRAENRLERRRAKVRDRDASSSRPSATASRHGAHFDAHACDGLPSSFASSSSTAASSACTLASRFRSLQRFVMSAARRFAAGERLAYLAALTAFALQISHIT